jgi:hypothetical protein
MMSYPHPFSARLQERALPAAFAYKYRLFDREIRPERAFSFHCSSEAYNVLDRNILVSRLYPHNLTA